MPTLSDISFRFLFANGSNNLIGDLFYWHHPKQSFAFCHCRIDEAGADVGDVDMAAALVSLLAHGFHVVDLIGFRCAVGWSHRLAAQSACRGDGDEVAVALLLKDLVERINDERPAYVVGVDGRTLHGEVQRGIDVARTRADDGEVNIFQFGTEGFDGSESSGTGSSTQKSEPMYLSVCHEAHIYI